MMRFFAAVAALFHFANAAMLPLLSEKLALNHPGREAALTSGAIIVAQLVTARVALLVARADKVGRKPLLILAVAALVLRGIMFTLSDHVVWLMIVEVLDGIGGGLFDAFCRSFSRISCRVRDAIISLAVWSERSRELADCSATWQVGLLWCGWAMTQPS